MAKKSTRKKASAKTARVRDGSRRRGRSGDAGAAGGETESASRGRAADRDSGPASSAGERRRQADRVVRQHVLWAMGAGLIPIPLVDFAAVTGVQVDLLGKLARVYGVEHAASTGKSFVVALTGTTFARLGASVVKILPGIGSVVGGLSMSVLSGASTYAVAQVAIDSFARGRDLLDVDLGDAKKAYAEAYEEGKDYAAGLEDERDAADAAGDVFSKLEKLGRLKEQGVLSEAEFEAQKKKLLDRL